MERQVTNMLRISQIVCPIDHTEANLFAALCEKLKCRESDILSWKIARQSIDARKKPNLFYSYTLLAKCKEEEKLLKRLRKDTNIVKDSSVSFHFQITGTKILKHRPVIIGTGPAGLFCGLELARAGFCPVLFERGKDVESRCADVEAFWRGKPLREDSNVQFGEGGAGTFSDGKLNTLVKDKYGRNLHVLETFVKFGAKKSIIYENKPHLGTDALQDIVKNIRREIISLGGEVHFESRMTDIRVFEPEKTSDGGERSRQITALQINGKNWVETDVLVLAIGHSARDTFFMLHEKELDMAAKPFAVGFRVQHPQTFINNSHYGTWDAPPILGAAPYKLTARAKDDRGVYSFCMCPGGYVVNASSEKGHLAVNGMSYSGRDGDCANSAIIVSISPEDYGSSDSPLSGIAFQRELEKRAFEAAGGKIPIQKYGDYQKELCRQGLLKETSYSDALSPFAPALKGSFKETDLTGILPPVLNKAFVEGMNGLDHKIRGFSSGEVWLCGIESRTSSPIRINRNELLQGNIVGIYPCGEGAGYAGGITSAAMDGIKVAQEIGALYHP